MNDIQSSTASFEAWLVGQLTRAGGEDPGGLDLKHEKMDSSLFSFMRGTFYRWAELWGQSGESGVAIGAAGDVHVENFGVWEVPGGGQVWGINDFDEAALLPWTSDLTRLGVSVVLGLEEFPMSGVTVANALDAILDGYSAGLMTASRGGAAHQSRAVPQAMKAIQKKVDPDEYWNKQDDKLRTASAMPASAAPVLAKILGSAAAGIDYKERKPKDRKGTGSLGKKRFFALAKVGGERVMAEAKAFVPSALEWLKPGAAGPGLKDMLNRLGVLAEAEYGCDGAWLARRLAPGMVKSELGDLQKFVDKGKITAAEVTDLFKDMGGTLAQVHSLDPASAKVSAELAVNTSKPKWYAGLVQTWRDKIATDFKAYPGLRAAAGFV